MLIYVTAQLQTLTQSTGASVQISLETRGVVSQEVTQEQGQRGSSQPSQPSIRALNFLNKVFQL